ncbi:DNA-3-methyladenine glycosylase 2 family protein [Pyxidicoccus parkwayensis]|uniref:DNA-3-methyladenine glycosylase II n=1 Tax=Pyxidicoccus parkwayensis TaxID=2813578 RepID=A0ABX7NTX1_9BACT|nr:DNA-3-methyladenine glycosylase 2 [Pyxidicoccus parkwaysis]QSQ22317.1 DNA-3-methyladenine glycosylase 2 family protein [Pyxidicoccus parkwaysis]
MDLLDRDACYRVLQTRDARFDGRLFVGVTSTGIYCRPICPARTPLSKNCQFYASAAAAQEAGFRPCLRCRPETAPDLASWRGTSNTVSRALAIIADGGLDGGEAGVDELAERLGVGGRQLRRLFKQHLGASPVSVAQTRRVLFAKQLIQETRMPMAEVALAAGFGSVRRFNETFHDLYHRPPSELRRKALTELPAGSEAGVTLRLRYRPPYDWAAMLAYLEARAIDCVERVLGECYQRTVSQDGRLGTVEVRHEPARNNLIVTVRFPSVQALPAILARVRRVFDVGADIETIGAHLSRDPFLAPLLAQRPGLRAPGGWDGFELAVRAILGQQVTVVAARQLACRLVALCGEVLPEEARVPAELSRAFPSPERVASTDLGALGMPSARRASLKALAEAAMADPHLFRPFGTVEEAIARLRSIRGVGEWTAQYIALRALRETDAFPASDVGLLRGASNDAGERPTPEDLLQRAEPWRPWRAYAAQHLWAADAVAGQQTREARHG